MRLALLLGLSLAAWADDCPANTPPAPGNRPAKTVCTFEGGKLTRIRYLFTATHEDLNAFVTDYHAVDKLLVKQYGEQESDHTVWESAEYQNESLTYLQSDRARPSDIRDYDKNVGLVISLGYLKLYTEWENVLHAMTGANGRVTHQVDVLVRDTKE